MRHVAHAASEYKCFFLVVWMHALNLIQQDYLERQCRSLGLGLHWCIKQAVHMLLQHKRQSTGRGSWLLHVPSLHRQDMFTLLSLLQAG